MLALPAKRLVAIALLLLAAGGAIRALEPALRARQVEYDRTTAPAPILEYVTFGHRRGVSAALWLQLLTWYGGKTMATSRATLHEHADVVFLQKQSRLIIRMDPDFADPYSFAALVLTWYAGEPLAALPFLVAAMSQFPDNWEYPFYYGFIHYHFMNDKKTAATFFLRASRLPRAPAFVPLLAARLLRQEDGTGDAIVTLEEMLRTNPPEWVRNSIQDELVTLRAIDTVEKARARYRQRTGRDATLDDLVAAGYLREIPVDQLGVPVYIDPDGKVNARSGGLH
jgi:hypothetical protein